MMSKLAKLLVKPSFWLGAGMGCGIGVVAASGVEIAPSDGARFGGALLGAFIAVAGAFTLHFFKESSDEIKRRERVTGLLEQLKAFNGGIADKAQNGSDELLSASLRVTDRFLKRCKRVLEKWEHDDNRIALVSAYFDNIPEDQYTRYLTEGDPYDDREALVELSARRSKTYEESISIIKTGSPN